MSFPQHFIVSGKTEDLNTQNPTFNKAGVQIRDKEGKPVLENALRVDGEKVTALNVWGLIYLRRYEAQRPGSVKTVAQWETEQKAAEAAKQAKKKKANV